MNCTRELIDGFVDEELDPGIRTEVEEHLANRRDCSEACSQIRERQAAIRSFAPYYDAPAHLHQSVREALKRATRVNPKTEVRNVPWRMLAIAASVSLVFSLAGNLRQLHTRTPQSETIAENILSSHVRSLIGTHLLDVV